MTITNKTDWRFAIGLPLFIFLSCFLVTLLPVFKLNRTLLSNAIVVDLLVTAPLAYFFVIRKSAISKMTVTRVFVAGLLVGGVILDGHTNALLYSIKTWVSPLIEVTVFVVIGRKFYLARKNAINSGKTDPDFLMYCRMIMCKVTGNEKAANILSSEIAVFYYSLFGKKDKNVNYTTRFTSYKENGIITVLAAVLSLFLIETTGVHFLLRMWNNTAAWILTALGFYTSVQLFGHIKAIKARPVSLSADALEIHNGLAGDAMITYSNIEKIEMSKKMPGGRQPVKIALLNGLENHNCVVYLKEPVYVTKIFGIKKRTDTVLFFVDRPADFFKSVNLKLADRG